MKTVVLIPAYNAAKTIKKVVDRIPADIVDEIYVVNDGSRDDTQAVLESLPRVRPLRHEKNKGYGAAQITLYKAAIASGADVAAIMHADGGHFPEELPAMLAPFRDSRTDMVFGSRTVGLLQKAKPLLGSRTLGATFRGEMPPHKFAANLALTSLANMVFRTNYHSFHCGFRAFRREALQRVPFASLTQGYLFDTAFLMECHVLGMKIVEVPISAHYDVDAGSSVNSIGYGFKVLAYIFNRRFRPAAVVSLNTAEEP